MNSYILPRLIRYRDAPTYLGMDRNRFDAEVRPTLIEIPVGSQGIAFDRIDLDAWVDNYKEQNGRKSRRAGIESEKTWAEQKHPASISVKATGTSIRSSSDAALEAALAKAASKKRR